MKNYKHSKSTFINVKEEPKIEKADDDKSKSTKKTNFLSKLFKAKLKQTIMDEKKAIEESRKTNLEKIIELLYELQEKESVLKLKEKISWAIQKLQYGKFYECESSKKSIVGDFFREIARFYTDFTENPNNISDMKIEFHQTKNLSPRFNSIKKNVDQKDQTNNTNSQIPRTNTNKKDSNYLI